MPEGLTLAVRDCVAEVVTHSVGEVVVDTEAEAHTEGRGEPEENVVPELERVALKLSVAQSEELPLVE